MATPQADIMTAPVAEEAVEAPEAAKPEPVAAAPAPVRTVDLTITLEDSALTQGGWVRGTVPAGTQSAMIGDTPVTFDEDGNFFAAFDRDAPSSLLLTAEHEIGRSLVQPLAIAPRAWDIERVNVAKGTGGGGEAWWAKREPEWLAIKEARERETGAQGWRQEFIWPVTGRISGRFGRQRIYRGEPGSYHSGIDIAPGDGTPFVAPADGVVVLARTGFSLEGGIIILDHGAGLNSAFIHLSQLSVSEGETVRQGQKLGNVGASGRATGPHLHWSLVWKDNRLDPLLFLPPMP
ncbi:M23 family metallopeptidase [Qipengyuania aurantiaca]|uniref:M23 family metallopeptidase n=1 Tax=Qipengyuania aurantiaca TaxID=2867233 RepID=A0ABX8ZTB3_9SPHN|nr:M23 family metallopeptidase [Qipengyuania aurantiaca]QZD90868.1 M23 family metallopeptidase [Qipengyuania aurantiaca]